MDILLLIFIFHGPKILTTVNFPCPTVEQRQDIAAPAPIAWDQLANHDP
jgi:hypothetical protein